MNSQELDAFDRYDAQPGRRYLALKTDSPERWLSFAVLHPKFKPAQEESHAHNPY